MKVGNIVSQSSINVSDDFNVVKSLDLITQGLPTLIIGWDFIKKEYPDYDILNKKLDDNLYWTFKKTEDRGRHEEDIFNFVHNTYNQLISNIHYVYIDPILFKRIKIKKIIRKIQSIGNILSYQHNDMIYIYGNNLIFGIDLNIIDFIGLNREKLINKIKSTSNIFLNKEAIFIEYKNKVENLGNQVKYIPYLYSIVHG